MSLDNPYEAPSAGPGKFDGGLKPLGSLAQSARGKEIKATRIAMILAGLLLLVFDGRVYLNSDKQNREIIREQAQGQDAGLDKVEFEKGIRFDYVFYGVFGCCGAALVGLGIFLRKSPVVFSILGLLIFAGVVAVFAYLIPILLFNFWFWFFILFMVVFLSSCRRRSGLR